MARTQARGIQRREEILQAALACFLEHGVDATTIEQIRDRSGASIGSLYHHFGNKERIAATLYLQGLRDFGESLLARLSAASDARAGVAAMVDSFIDWVLANPDWARFLFTARGQAVRGDVEEELKQANRAQAHALRAWLEPHIASGAIRRLPLELYRPLISGPVQDYTRAWLAGRVTSPPERFREEFVAAAWRAVGGDVAD